LPFGDELGQPAQRCADWLDVVVAQLAVVAGDELSWRRQRRQVVAESSELPALADLVGVLDRVEVGRIDLVGERLQLRPVALDLGRDDRRQFAALGPP
jgi:hypothetical protein